MVLDFASLLARHQKTKLKPAGVVQITPREAFQLKSTPATPHNSNSNKNEEDVNLLSSPKSTKPQTIIFKVNHSSGKIEDVIHNVPNELNSHHITGTDDETEMQTDDCDEDIVHNNNNLEIATVQNHNTDNKVVDHENTDETKQTDAPMLEFDGTTSTTPNMDHLQEQQESYYYIIGDDHLSVPYAPNSREYFIEEFLSSGYHHSYPENHTISSYLQQHQQQQHPIYRRMSSSSHHGSSKNDFVPDGDETVINDNDYESAMLDNSQQQQQQSQQLHTKEIEFKAIIREMNQIQKANDLAYHLSYHTIPSSYSEDHQDSKTINNLNLKHHRNNENDLFFNSLNGIPESERIRLEKMRKRSEAALSSHFHEVELGDWENQINWEGVEDTNSSSTIDSSLVNHSDSNDEDVKVDGEGNDTATPPTNNTTNTTVAAATTAIGQHDVSNAATATTHTTATTQTIPNKSLNKEKVQNSIPSSLPIRPIDPQILLSQAINPELDALDFTKLISWEGADAPRGYNHSLAKKIGNLILQENVSGSSIYKISGPIQPSDLNPLPFHQSEVFQRRLERIRAGSVTVGPVSTLQTDQAQLEEEIARRQKKRAQMAIEKTTRVTEAMGTLALGGGRGRTITSSLMGPGGTERTGRPSRIGSSSLAHDAELVEHLELVYSHTLVKPDLKKSELRHFHRPKLPIRCFRVGEICNWQLNVLVKSVSNKGGKGGARGLNTAADGSTLLNSYQSSMVNATPGSISQSKIRNEADLSPTEGSLVLLEYCEERPPIQMSKGMACKIVNYFRGERSKCPISAGGGDRPIKKKKHGDKNQGEDAMGSSGKVERPPRLLGPDADSECPSTLIGKIGNKKSSETTPHGKKDTSVTVFPEGVTEILHSKVHGPFIGEVKEGVTQTGLICNLFAAPMFRHEPKENDFLMILGKKPSSKHISPDKPPKLSVVIRPLPTSLYTVGQTEPRIKVPAPFSTAEKNFMTSFSVFHIAKALQRTQNKEHRGLKIDEINDGLFTNTDILQNALRQRIKQVAVYDKNTQIWTLKDVGYDDFPGIEALGRRFNPEGVSANETACAAVQRLRDLGIHELFTLNNSVASVANCMTYLNGAITAARERKSKMSKLVKAQTNILKAQNKTKLLDQYILAEKKLEAAWKELKRRGEVARFIFEELQLTPWHLTSEFIDIHKNSQSSGMMRLTGIGDPSGGLGGFNFIREVDTKPNKVTSSSGGELNARIKKITGTDNDLRKLTMKEMASILRSYGMGQKEIDTLKRWDRVHVIRDMSTKAASDNMADGMERYARGEKMKLSDQKQMYRERIQEIWERQRAALSTDASQLDNFRGAYLKIGDTEVDDDDGSSKGRDMDKDDDSDDESLFDDFDLDDRQANELVSNHYRNETGESFMRPAVAMQHASDSQELSKDARELAALKRQREEERAVQSGLDLRMDVTPTVIQTDRKIIRRKITKTHPDGRQFVTFKFIALPNEVEKIIAMKKNSQKSDESTKKKSKKKSSRQGESIDRVGDVIGHSLFEEEEDYSSRIKLQVKRKARGGSKGRKTNASSPPKLKRPSEKQLKMKDKTSQVKKVKKRKRESDADLYEGHPRRKGTSNRKERGAARERMPHVIMADRLEQIRSDCEKRPGSGEFHRPVSKRMYPRYYEVISDPMDLQTIRDKNQRYEYKTANAFVKDFEIMKLNAVKFNGPGSVLGNEATAIYEFVKDVIETNRNDFTSMEMAVEDQMNSNKKKRGNSYSSSLKVNSNDKNAEVKKVSTTAKTANITLDGITTTVNIGDLPESFVFEGSDSDAS